MGFGGLRTPYAVLIIVLMVVGIIAGGSYFFYSTQNPCGSPGSPVFGTVYQTTVDVNGQPKQFNAVAATFTGVQQNINFNNTKFVTTDFNDPSQPHLINGVCGSDHGTPAAVTVQVTLFGGRTESLMLSYKGNLPYQTENFTSSYEAGLQWIPGNISILLLVAV